MCGLVGVVGDPKAVARLAFDLSAAVSVLRPRGPDDRGVYVDRERGIHLGHTRLAIIDVSENAHQPMCSESNDYAIVFNGEIYNFRELFEEYCRNDKLVNSRSDTAVLLSLLRQQGHECLTHLNGMFAFAAVNLRTNRILLARDRFGEKPLYWMQLPGAIAFASELRALRALGLLNGRDIEHQALGIYQAMGSIPPPFTIYRGVQAILPASYIVFEGGRRISEGQYWRMENFALGDREENSASAHEIWMATLQRLRDAVDSRMVSDVPVGLFLSGGYDSGSLLALCHAVGQPPAKLLCMDFEEKQFSEYSQAKEIARQFGMDVARSVLTEKDFTEGLPGFFRSMDQPTTDGYNTYFISRAAREAGIKVWLSGVGGDELFGGYPSFWRLSRLRALSRFGQMVVSRSTLDFIAPLLQERLRYSRVLHMFDKGDPSVRAYQCCRQVVPWRNVGAFFSVRVRQHVSKLPTLIDSCFPDISDAHDSFQMASILESAVYMRSQLLRDMDNFSMAHSVELRAPFLDHRLFRHVMSVKETLKRGRTSLKPLLTESMRALLPRTFLQGPKRGFTFPVEIWLKGLLKRSFEEIVLDKSNAEYLDLENIRVMWDAHQRGRVHWAVPWSVYAFSRWRMEQSANAQ